VQCQTQIAARWPPFRFCSILSPVIALVFFKMHSPSGAYPSLESGSVKLPLLPFFLSYNFQFEVVDSEQSSIILPPFGGARVSVSRF
jgi:hypothetical protein